MDLLRWGFKLVVNKRIIQLNGSTFARIEDEAASDSPSDGQRMKAP